MNLGRNCRSFCNSSGWEIFHSNQEQRWKRDSSQSEDTGTSKLLGSKNIFSNDGSFLDQFKKLSGVKGKPQTQTLSLKIVYVSANFSSILQNILSEFE
jgi:hypothetical protein